MGFRFVILLALTGTVLSQKLFFKSNKDLTQIEKEPVNGKVVTCPGGKSACPDGNTCCMLINRAYGCCALPNATCCLDGAHCCPKGLKCDVRLRACINGETVIPWSETLSMIDSTKLNIPTEVKKVNSLSLETSVGAVVCPDGAHECQTGNTCCQSPNGFACCSFKDAVCCSDHVHCCPKGTMCDLSHSRCLRQKGDIFLSLLDKKPGLGMEQMTYSTDNERQEKAVQCDSSHECPTGNTCCRLSSGQWGCCPKPNAVCCSDHVHCCEHGYTCDTGSGKCIKGDLITDWYEKTSANKIGNVQCDDTHECMTGTTCCKTENGEWGCCPLPNAICCSDHVHCCPSGTTCDVASGKCIRGYTQIDWFKKEVAVKVGSVKCDATHECPSGNTCCKLASGQWGCCPLPNAVCCSDGVHCCPSGYTCEVSTGKCNHGNIQMDWFKKESAIKVGSVKCDSTHECPDGNTCCKLSSGQWGCCPLPNAECCSDGVHCCPSGYTCEVSSGKCNHSNIQIDWFKKESAIKVGSVKCDSTHECPDGNTCCKLSSGQWGCCPLPNAECCSDGVHCCPSGYTCEVSSGKCNHGNIQIDWFKKESAIKVGSVMCDDTHECPDGNTCCKLSSGQWGCCPLPNAECCSDGVHCCPSGYTCEVSTGKCNHGNIQIDWFKKVSAIKVGSVMCDSTHECPDGNTCCKLSSGQWGCCPLPNAECCSDGVHCCPSGYTCEVSSGKCNHGNIQIDWFKKGSAIKVGNVICDSTHECPDGNTCCKLSSGQWGCCPLPNAECCSDGVHCCPSGYTCEVSSGKCNHGNVQIDWFKKVSAIKVGNVMCDSTHECPDGNTCCKLSSGQWGCCPLPNAECCSDGVHCCPSGYTCEVSTGKCNHGNIQIDWLKKESAIKVGSVMCDSTHECPDGNTCCKLSSGQWGCCPLPSAECCSDGVHCCPSGYTCDVSSGKCNKGNIQIDWFQKEIAVKVGSVKCDATHECATGQTCCRTTSGQWGCCPLPKAECCSDHVHCCPNGYKCQVSTGKCNKGNIQIDWFQKEIAVKVGSVKCDTTHECATGQTCCRTTSSQWGCCPLPKAVCCEDHVHCCPEGTTCALGSGKCNRGNIQIDWFKKEMAIKVDTVKCPDGEHECKTGQTCCKTASGQYGCCPLPKAVCCSDHVHCCPGGTTCDVTAGKCNRGDMQIDWFEKELAIKLDTVKCPDGEHECKTGQTCCKTASGQYGCCPLPKAVCCSDHVHCCPGGTTCDVTAGKCNRGNLQTDWFEKELAIKVDTVKCPGGKSECKTGQTCCKTASGQWGCCPIPKAVCCSDHVHCCPEKTTCNVSQGKCDRGDIQIDWFEKELAIKVDTVKCPDGDHECETGQTCCKTASGQWGCCPLPKAVCCDDHVHCCPESTTCDVSSGKCIRGNVQIDWLKKEPAISREAKLKDVICPDGSECQDGQTCCQMVGKEVGTYGCCPLPNAVCCSDGQHCCPCGYKCDVSHGTCKKGYHSLNWFKTLTSHNKNPRHPLQEDVGPVAGGKVVQNEEQLKQSNVQCNGTVQGCPDGYTCCPKDPADYACCPYHEAICCPDKQTCCPKGYICDEEPRICRIPELGQAASKFLNKLYSRKASPLV